MGGGSGSRPGLAAYATRQIAKFANKDTEIEAAEGAISEYTFQDTSSGAAKEKAFCKTCGTPLWTVPGAAKGSHRIIRTAILDGG